MQNTGNLIITTPSDREIAMTRSFNASRELVFEAFTKPDLLKRWLYGPPGWRLDVCNMDLRPGGVLRWEWRGPGGEMGLSGTYREIVPPERIVHTELFDEDWTGGETLVTWLLEEQDGVTTLTMTVLYSSQEARDVSLQTPMAEGVEMGYVRLDQILAEMPNGSGLFLERIFNAPVETVWRAWTEPELVMRWWGPSIFSCPAAQIDLQVGGKFLFCMQSDQGPDLWQKGMWATGEYREIVPMDRIVFTDSFADAQGNVVPATYYDMPDDIPLEMLVTVTFEDFEGQTKITLRHTGLPEYMQQDAGTGWGESLDKMAQILAG